MGIDPKARNLVFFQNSLTPRALNQAFAGLTGTSPSLHPAIPMRPPTSRLSSSLTAIFLALGAPGAQAGGDNFSTGPGQGGPDGLCDVWQWMFNGWGLNPSDDLDNDGCSNLVESLAGTDPRKPGDCLKVGNTVVSGNSVVFSFDAERGKKYRVLCSDTPSDAPENWSPVAGAEKVPSADNPGETIVITKPAGSKKFYKLEVTDQDQDGDGLSDWVEGKTGSDPSQATSASNASGGVASDADTLASLMSVTVTPGAVEAFEKEGVEATVRVQRTVGTMPLRIKLTGLPGATLPTKSSAGGSDFVIKSMSGEVTDTVQLPAGQGVSEPYEIARIAPVPDATLEVPEELKIAVAVPAALESSGGTGATVKIYDANPADPANQQLYVAFLGREAGAASTASGYATALVDGANNTASISVVFNNLSSDQNTAYIRIGPDLEVQVLPLGQVSGTNWNIRAAQTIPTDQRMLDALEDGEVYVAITTVNFPDKEIWGYFNKAAGSVNFDEANPNLAAPVLGSTLWETPAGEALERDIWRFMNQATMGGTTALYNEIRAEVDAAISGGGTYLQGLSNWMDKQMDPAQTPTLNYRQLVTAADMEEFALRGNKPITYNADPQQNGGTIGVTFVNGMPVANAGSPNTNDPGNNYPGGGNTGSPNRRREWWTMILQSRDHLRQRVTQALSEICVISERDTIVSNFGYGAANWWDMLAAGAFGKYRDLLQNVTLNPMMGIYLTSMANRATYESGGIVISPDENYAREIMQLFSIGLVLRHPDGSLILSEEGLPIATYDNNDITELARVFTGFSHGARNGTVRADRLTGYGGVGTTDQRISPTVYANGSTNNIWFGRQDGHRFWQTPWITPMVVIGRQGTTVYHDFNAKTLFAAKHGELPLPAQTVNNASPFVPATDAATHAMAMDEVVKAHDMLAGRATDATYPDYDEVSPARPGHTNTPVNISRWLIQRLVTSNPSAGYIYRVQNAYRGSNGNLGAVVKAILLDYEARSLQLADTAVSHGKLKEPMIHFAHILRQFRAYSGAPVSILRDMQTGFSETDAPMAQYPATEYAKFSMANVNPPSKPNGWADGPFRYRIDSLRNNLGQSPLDAPTVFNWFYPDFTVPGKMAQAGLFAPEMQTATEAAEVSKINFLYAYTWSTLAHMSNTPGVGVADFLFRNAWATPAVRFSTNGGSTLMNWPATITLNDTNWNTGVTVTLVGVNNRHFSEMAYSGVRYAVSGSAPGYNGVATLPTPVTFVENESKNEQLVVSATGGSTWVTEGGMTDIIKVSLSAPPAIGASVDVALAAQNGEVSVSPAVLTFDSANWNVAQDVTVTAVEDAEVENAGTGNDLVNFTVSSTTSANYHGITTAPHPVSVNDNDGGYGVIITQSGGTTLVNETSATTVNPLSAGMDSYTIALTRAPTANVAVTITGTGTQINSSPTSTTFGTSYTRTFTTTNWNVPQTVVVRGNNDTTQENTHTGTISHSINTAAGGYPVMSTAAIEQITATITDDDNAIMIAHSDGETRVIEDGMTDTVTVRLRSNPNAPVSVTLSSSQLAFSPSTLIFNPTSAGTDLWSTERTVTVSANDDHLVEGLHTSTIYAYSQSAGSNYNGSTPGSSLLLATIIDNDDARVVISETDGSTLVNENGLNDTYTIALGRQPDAGSTTTVSLALSTTAIQVSPSGPFTFTEANWNTPVTVTVSTPNDTTAETRATGTITHNVTSTDGTYDRVNSPVVVVTMDDNEPALTVTQTNIFTQVKEGGSAGTGGTPAVGDTFTVAPARTLGTGTSLLVTLVPDAQVTVNPPTLTFTSTTAQTVTVTAADDAVAESPVHRGLVGFRLESTDTYYNGTAVPPVLVQVTDNDSPGISVVESGGTTANTEGSTTTDSFTVVLTRQPAANVDVFVDGGVQSRISKTSTVGTGTTATLNFTPANWATAQTVWTLAVDDTAAELRHLSPISLSVTPASSAEYAALTVPPVTHILSDNDNNVASNVVRITESGGSTTTTESGSSDTFTVVLSQQPTAPVTLTFTGDGQISATPSVLTFVPGASGAGTFNVAQTITVRAVDDSVIEPAILHWGQIIATASSADPFFNGATISPVTSSVYDNDGPRVILDQSGGSTVVKESGVTDTISLVLSHEPVADVTITSTANAQLSLAPAVVTFTSANWNVPQTVTVAAVNDTAVETPSHSGGATFAITSADPLYHGISVPALTAQVWDNDSAGIDITHVGGTDTVIAEGGSNDAILVKLNTQPPAGTSVTITLYPPAFYVPPPQHGKTAGYFNNDQGGNNQRDNVVIDYTESILKYRSTFYSNLAALYAPAPLPSNLATAPTANDIINIQKSHWAAAKAVVDQMDLWFNGGSMKARHPVLIEPHTAPPSPLPPPNPRQAVIEAIYAHSGGADLPATRRYENEIPFNPKSPSTTTFANEVRDRVRWCGYLMSVGAPGLISH